MLQFLRAYFDCSLGSEGLSDLVVAGCCWDRFLRYWNTGPCTIVAGASAYVGKDGDSEALDAADSDTLVASVVPLGRFYCAAC